MAAVLLAGRNLSITWSHSLLANNLLLITLVSKQREAEPLPLHLWKMLPCQRAQLHIDTSEWISYVQTCILQLKCAMQDDGKEEPTWSNALSPWIELIWCYGSRVGAPGLLYFISCSCQEGLDRLESFQRARGLEGRMLMSKDQQALIQTKYWYDNNMIMALNHLSGAYSKGKQRQIIPQVHNTGNKARRHTQGAVDITR